MAAVAPRENALFGMLVYKESKQMRQPYFCTRDNFFLFVTWLSENLSDDLIGHSSTSISFVK